jgi:ankyrin repeat protein
MSGKQPKRKPRPGVDISGRTPLHYAAPNGDVSDVAKQLAGGANPNVQDDNGWTPLHFAAQAVSADVTKALLSAGAALDLQDSFGNTALSTAVFNSKGDGTVIKLLREAGSDPSVKNKSGVSPILLARNIGNFNVAKFFLDLP